MRDTSKLTEIQRSALKIRDRYIKQWGSPIPLSHCFTEAKKRAEFSDLDWDYTTDGVSWQDDRGVCWEIRVELDACPDVSYLGEFTNMYMDGSIRNPDAWVGGERSNARILPYFVPENDVRGHAESLRRYYGRARAWELARAAVVHDMEMAREPNQYIVTISAKDSDGWLTEVTVGGVELDDAAINGERLIYEAWRLDLLHEGRAEVDNALAARAKVAAETRIKELGTTMAETLASYVSSWARTPGNHGGNPYALDMVKYAENVLSVLDGRVQEWPSQYIKLRVGVNA